MSHEQRYYVHLVPDEHETEIILLWDARDSHAPALASTKDARHGVIVRCEAF